MVNNSFLKLVFPVVEGMIGNVIAGAVCLGIETAAFLVTEMLAPFLKLGIMNFGLSIHVIILRDYVFSANRTNRTKRITD